LSMNLGSIRPHRIEKPNRVCFQVPLQLSVIDITVQGYFTFCLAKTNKIKFIRHLKFLYHALELIPKFMPLPNSSLEQTSLNEGTRTIFCSLSQKYLISKDLGAIETHTPHYSEHGLHKPDMIHRLSKL
jgi:hypothetical protein